MKKIRLPKRHKAEKSQAAEPPKRGPVHKALHITRRIIRPFFRFYFIFLFLITFLILLGAFVSITYITYAKDITTKEKIMNRRNSGIIIYDKTGQILFQEGQAREFKITPLASISPIMVKATLASEDVHFYNHPGVSVSALVASAIADFKHVDPFKYGGSTITQQLVKNSVLGGERTYSRKLREIVLALEIERKFTKDEILEMYLNSVYYGAGAYGINEASQVYFNTEPAKLTPAQAAFLAGLPNAPSFLSPYGGNKDKALERQQYVLQQMLDNKLLTQNEYNQAQGEQLTFAPPKERNTLKAPHFALWVRKKLFEQFGEEQAERLGYRVYTTLDPKMQEAGEAAVSQRVSELANLSVTNGSLVAMDPKTGAILAMVGSANYDDDSIDGKFNVAVDGIGRQPGSSFKPLVYVTAFERRLLTPASIMHDVPTDFGVFGGEHFKPKNYDGRFHGNVTARRALANSLNIPAVEVLRMVGVDNAIDTAHRLGITTLQERDRYGLSLVLGGGEVHLLEMVQAYGTFANNGKLAPYYSIEKITDKFGDTVYEHSKNTPPEKQVLIPAAAYLLTHILSDNNARTEVFGANSPLRLSRPAAAKTGTTDDYKDSWTLGYTPNLVAGAWIGNNNGIPMKGVAGALGAANVWKNFMERALKDMPVENFTEPEGVVKGRTCQRVQTKEVRYLDDGTPYDHFEDRILSTEDVFMRGTEPKGCTVNDSSPWPSGQLLQPVNEPSPLPTNPMNPNQDQTNADNRGRGQNRGNDNTPNIPGQVFVPNGVSSDNLPVYFVPPPGQSQ